MARSLLNNLMNFKLFCPFCSKMCTTSDSLLYYDNHCNYCYPDYFLPSQYRDHYQKYKDHKLFKHHILDEVDTVYSIVTNRFNICFTLENDNAYEELDLIDRFEMHFYKPVFKLNGILIYMKDEDLRTRKQVRKINDDTQIEKKINKRIIKSKPCMCGAIYKSNFSHKLDLNLKKEYIFNTEITYIYLLSEDFSYMIYEQYLETLPSSAITLIRLFVGSTKYIIRNLLERQYYFFYMKAFNDRFRDRARKNFTLKQLNAKEFIPSKYKKNDGSA